MKYFFERRGKYGCEQRVKYVRLFGGQDPRDCQLCDVL